MPEEAHPRHSRFGDRGVRLKEVYRTGWLRAFAMALFFLAAMGPAQLLHHLNHTVAMGAPGPAVWALMAWDALVVALMACWAGTGLAAGYALANGTQAPAQSPT